jgi:hypothetical protein
MKAEYNSATGELTLTADFDSIESVQSIRHDIAPRHTSGKDNVIVLNITPLKSYEASIKGHDKEAAGVAG